MTLVEAPFGYDSRPAPRFTALDGLAFALCVLIMLIYSQGWMTPIFGADADESASSLMRDIYLPAYGALLSAVAMMAAGWDGSPAGQSAPGFPQDGSWKVRSEGLHRLP